MREDGRLRDCTLAEHGAVAEQINQQAGSINHPPPAARTRYAPVSRRSATLRGPCRLTLFGSQTAICCGGTAKLWGRSAWSMGAPKTSAKMPRGAEPRRKLIRYPHALRENASGGCVRDVAEVRTSFSSQRASSANGKETAIVTAPRRNGCSMGSDIGAAPGLGVRQTPNQPEPPPGSAAGAWGAGYRPNILGQKTVIGRAVWGEVHQL